MDDITDVKTVTIHANKDEGFEVTPKKKFKQNYGHFSMVGWLRRKTTRKVYMDIFDCLTKVSKSAIILFNEIKLNSDADFGVAVMTSFEDLNKAQMSSVYKRLAELQKVNLIKKVIPYENPNKDSPERKSNIVVPEKYTYMINPNYIKPWKIDLAQMIWEKI